MIIDKDIFSGLHRVTSDESQIIANKKAGVVYIADFVTGEGKYISTVVEDSLDLTDIQVKISPKIELRITYIANEDKITGIRIIKVKGKEKEVLNLSTLTFERILKLLHIFGELELKSLASGSLILDSSIIQNEQELRKHLNTILADKDGAKVLAEVAAGVSGGSSNTISNFLNFLSSLSNSEKVDQLLNSLQDVDIENLSAAYRQKNYQQELLNLEKLLEFEQTSGNFIQTVSEDSELCKYKAGQTEKIFQNWIENNLWVFGTEYIKQHEARRIAFYSISDLLMESMDGFLDLIELKLPKAVIFKYDDSHKCYFPSPELSEVIGQCLFYLQKMDEFKLNLEKDYKVKMIRPRIKIIIGRTNNYNDEQFAALRMLNSHLYCMQVVSYDYLLSCGKKLVENYN